MAISVSPMYFVDPRGRPEFAATLVQERAVKARMHVSGGSMLDLYGFPTIRIVEYICERLGAIPLYPWVYVATLEANTVKPWTAAEKKIWARRVK